VSVWSSPAATRRGTCARRTTAGGNPASSSACFPAFLNPEEEAYGLYDRPRVTLYRVRFRQVDLWPEYTGPLHDTVDIEIYEHWLEPAAATEVAS